MPSSDFRGGAVACPTTVKVPQVQETARFLTPKHPKGALLSAHPLVRRLRLFSARQWLPGFLPPLPAASPAGAETAAPLSDMPSEVRHLAARRNRVSHLQHPLRHPARLHPVWILNRTANGSSFLRRGSASATTEILHRVSEQTPIHSAFRPIVTRTRHSVPSIALLSANYTSTVNELANSPEMSTTGKPKLFWSEARLTLTSDKLNKESHLSSLPAKCCSQICRITTFLWINW